MTGKREWKLVRGVSLHRSPLVLDPVQRAVIAHNRGALLVRGAAGTGKTTTLVEAVAQRVAEGVDPQRILVLTFGRRSAGLLREQIEARIVSRKSTHEVLVRTFPAYAYGLLKQSSTQMGEPPPRLLSGPEQDLVIRELLPGTEYWPERLAAALPTRAFAEQLRDLLLRAAERGVTAADRLWKKRDDWLAAARFLREYEQTMALRDATTRGSIGYDHAELVQAAIALLDDDPLLLEAERTRLQHIYVDELSDTDPAQIKLLQRVAFGKPMVAFGDADSSIYAFRGADPGVMRTFPDMFEARELGLSIPHRSFEPSREIVTVRSRVSEAAYVAQRLRRAHVVDGVPWSKMAVIMRAASTQLSGYERALRNSGVPVRIHAEDLPLHQQPAVQPFLMLLRCALDTSLLDEETAVALLHSPLGGADPLAERKLRQGLRALAQGGDSGQLLIDALRDPTELVALERRWAEPAIRIGKLMQTALAAANRPHSTAEEVLWAVWKASNLAERWAGTALQPSLGLVQQRRSEAADRDLDAMMVLFDAAARFTDRLPGARISTFLEHVLEQQLPADSLAARGARDEAVRLLTAHAAKGLEWDFVVVAGVQEGIWPDLRLRGTLLGSEHLVDEVSQRAQTGEKAQRVAQTSALLSEERRLFHVATTRARRDVLITAVDSGAVGGSDNPDLPSRFLYESKEAEEAPMTRPPRALTLAGLVAELRAVASSDSPEATLAAAELARLADKGVQGAHPDHWWGLADISDDGPLFDGDEAVRVTPSTIESALRCGLRWLLEKHGGAAASTSAQGVGNLVHAAAMLAEDAVTDPAVLMEYVHARFDAIELAARWLAGRERERADEMLGKLTRWLAENPRRLVAIEREFTVRLEGEPPVELRGRVDRLEIDDEGRLVVIDLKTGKATAATAAELPEHPQLGAYQVAVAEGGFPEGDESGGAALVQLGVNKEAKEQSQDAIGESAWAHDMVHRTALTMAASTFMAKTNDKCRVCPVKTSCPVSGKGRQVVEP